ncbi:hypothetical protein Gotur_013392 [Gossypium turneri]
MCVAFPVPMMKKRPIPSSYLKFNCTDGSVVENPSPAGIGGILCDDQGEELISFSKLNAKQLMGEENKKIRKEEVIAKLKDDGDFDKLRLKIIRKLKDNVPVKQLAALNCLGSKTMKVRQLLDAIHDEVG